MINFLEGFEKRMEMVGIVESIINRKNKNLELERLFSENDFINLVFSVLLYIMEKTLSEDSDCDKEHILKFIESILPQFYSLHLENDQLSQLTNYIIKNVLQNEGVPYRFNSINYTDNSRKNIIIRLIRDQVLEVSGGYKINYSLTDQGYDFLFRTKEVDQEIQITIEELKLKELIKRKNFKKAQDQSLNLIQMVRQKKKEIQTFIIKIKENIHDVNIDEYEKLIKSTYELLSEEYELLNEIMEMSRKSEDKIRQEYELSLNLDESLKKAQWEIKQINNNIKVTLSEQKDLILTRQSLSKVYIDTIADSFVHSMENRYDIESVVLRQMEEHVDMVERFWQIVNPLFRPNPYRNMNIRNIYEPQGMIKLEEEEKVDFIEEEDLTEDLEKKRVKQVNEIYIEILDSLFTYVLNQNKECSLEEVIDYLRKDPALFNRLIDDRLFFTTILKLYDIGVIDIAQWKKEENKVIMNLTEEFNLEYCLYQIMDRREYMDRISKILFLKRDEALIEIEINRKVKDDLSIIEKIEISNFYIRVEKSHEQR